LLPSLGSADTMIYKLSCDDPSGSRCCLTQRLKLILAGLAVGAD
jgi:hypothetical protein